MMIFELVALDHYGFYHKTQTTDGTRDAFFQIGVAKQDLKVKNPNKVN